MLITTGRVRGGKIEVDTSVLPEGTKVTVIAREGTETFALGPEDETALLAAIVEAERGDTVTAQEVLSKIRGA